MARTKAEAIKTVVKCAERFEAELNKKNLLLICTDKHRRVSSIELTFHSWNYLHLTGLKSNAALTTQQFYERCLAHRLSPNDFEFSEDGTSKLKLDILPHVICKNLMANSIGDFNGKSPRLFPEKLAGGQKACIGFNIDGNSDEYVPNTLLKGDIRGYIISIIPGGSLLCSASPCKMIYMRKLHILQRKFSGRTSLFPNRMNRCVNKSSQFWAARARLKDSVFLGTLDLTCTYI